MRRIVTQLGLMFVLSCFGAGCASMALIDKTSSVKQTPLQLVSARRAKDVVVVRYRAQLQTRTGDISWEDKNFASFTLPHTPGTNQITGVRLRPSDIDDQVFPHDVPIVSPTDQPGHSLSTHAVVLWGSSFDAKDVTLIESTSTGDIGSLLSKIS